MKADWLEQLFPKKPYPGLSPFRLLDWRIFFEREAEIESLVNLVSLYRAVLLYGKSGAGKSSLLDAGLIPDMLRRGRAAERIRVFPQPGRELFVERIRLKEDVGASDGNVPDYLPSRFRFEPTVDRIAVSSEEFLKTLREPSELGAPLLIFDQFEELVTLFEENPKDLQGFEEARTAREAIQKLLYDLLLSDSLPLRIVFGFRDDYLARLIPFFSSVPNLMDHGLRLSLPLMDHDLLHQIVRGPFLPCDERGLKAGQFGEGLSEEVAQKVEDGIRVSQPSGVLNLSELQTLCLALWKEPKRRTELLRTKNPPAVLRRIIRSEAMISLKKKFWRWNRIRAIAVLSNLVTEDGTRNIVIQQMLVSQTRRNPALWVFRGKWNKFLKRLSETGLVRRSLTTGTTYHYELTSEFLIPQIQRWQQNLRMWRHLIVAGIAAILIAIPWSLYNKADAATKRARDALDKVKKANTAAESSAHEATSARNEAQNVMEFMLFDLPEKLEPIGRLDLLDDVNRRTLDYYKSHLDDKDAQRGYSAALRNKGDILYGRGDLPGALENYKKAFELIKNVADRDPSNMKVKHDLWESEKDMGTVLSDQRKFQDAKKSFDDSVMISEELTKKKPANLEWQLDLSESYDLAGCALLENAQYLLDSAESYDSRGRAILSPEEWGEFQEKVKKAGELCENSGGIARRVADSEPHNSRHYSRARHLMALGFGRRADVLWKQGDDAGSLEADKQCLSIIEKLVENEPGNSEWQRELSNMYGRLADRLATKGKKGNYPEVVEQYRNALKGFGKLVVQDPTNADWQYSLIYYYYGAAVVMNKMGPKSKAEAREFVEKGKEIKRKLENVGMTPRQTNELKALEKQLPQAAELH